MFNQARIHRKPTLAGAGAAVAAALAIVALQPASTPAAGSTETLKVFSQTTSFTFTAADGTVTNRPPAGEPKAGDVLEIDSLNFDGDHRRHAKRSSGSTYLRCEFTAGPEPTCTSVSAVGGSLLRFRGSEIIGGTGRYQGATGKVVKSTDVEGGSDIVVKIRRK